MFVFHVVQVSSKFIAPFQSSSWSIQVANCIGSPASLQVDNQDPTLCVSSNVIICDYYCHPSEISGTM